jgi:DNA-directed RNA polymerase specialized sigma24 family protein
VASSALASFYQGIKEGRYPQLADRDDLWRLLFTITIRKAKNLVRDERRKKRGGGTVRGDSALRGPDDSDTTEPLLNNVPSKDPDPVTITIAIEGLRLLIGRLGAGELRQIALWKLEGYTNEEIAHKLGCAVRTVERKLLVLRDQWHKDPQP